MARSQPDSGHDPSRREFFRTFSRETARNAGAVVGAASELRRTSVAAARELLDLGNPAAETDERAAVSATAEAHAIADASFRSAYRFTGDTIVVLDQRELPSRVLTYECRDAVEAAAAIRTGAVTPGPVLAEVGAYAIALAAAGAVERTAASREQRVRAAAGSLRAARREVRALSAAVDRMEARYDTLAAAGAAPEDIRSGLAAEADAVATWAMAANASLGRELSGRLVEAGRLSGGRVDVLVHGDGGPLSWGTVAPETAAFASSMRDGIELHVWVTEASPSQEGLRVTAYTLAQLDVPHTVIPDTGVGWLLANRPVACALLRADTTLVGGDVVALVGSLSIATVARAAQVPVYALAPATARDDVSEPTTLVPALRSAAESGAAPHARLEPAIELVPAALVSVVSADSGAPA